MNSNHHFSFHEIESSSNKYFKLLKSLNSSKGIKTEKLFFLCGKKLIQDYLNTTSWQKQFPLFSEITFTDYKNKTPNFYTDQFSNFSQKIFRYVLNLKLFQELDELGTNENLLVLKAPEVYFKNESLNPNNNLNVILPLSDPNNLGAAIRSCVGFGVHKIYLTTESANPFLQKSVRASAGSVLDTNFAWLDSVEKIPSENVVGFDSSGKDLTTYTWQKSSTILIGQEGKGLPAYVKNKISIPTEKIESLNATVALSIALFHYKQQFP
jgi:TrmH family RNA methyltransferase